MKKIGKKTIVIAAMIMLIGGALYLNWQLSDSKFSLTEVINGNKNLGEALLVDNASVASAISEETPKVDEVFSEMRLERQQSRDESISVLKSVTEAENLNDDEKKSAADTLAEVAKNIESETTIENLVKAKGFSECMAYIGEKGVTVTVRTDEELTGAEAGQIKDIVIGETGLTSDKIKIVEVI